MFSKIKKIILYIFAIYAFMGFILLPLLLKPQLIKTLNSELNATISLDNVSFNPFIFKLTLEGMQLYDIQKKPLVSFETLMFNIDPSSLLYGAAHIRKIFLEQPSINLTYNKNKTINLLSILKPQENTKDDNSTTLSLPRVIVDSIEVSEGELFYKDYTLQNPFEFSFEKIAFRLNDIDTKDINSSSANIRFYTTLGDGGFFDLHTDVVSLEPLAMKGSVDFEASKLYSEWKYIKDELNLEVADGKISFHTDYSVDVSELNATKLENMSVTIDKLRIKPKKEHVDVFNLENLQVKNASIYPFMQDVEIEKITLDGMSVKAKRFSDGSIDWVEFLRTKEKNEKEAEPVVAQDKSRPWSVNLHSLALQKINLLFDDEGVSPSVNSNIHNLDIYAQEITLEGAKPFTYQIDMKINKTAKCSMKGSLAHKELELLSELSCSDFDIAHYRPYIDTAAKEALSKYDIKLVNATAGFSSSLRVHKENNETVVNVSDTNLSVANLKLDKRSDKQKIVAFRKFSVNDLALDTQKKSVHIKNVSLDGILLHTKKYKNTKLNLEELIVAKKANKKKTKSKEEAYSFKLDKFALKDAKVLFRDESLKTPTTLTLDKIYFNAYDIDAKKYSWLSYNSSIRVNKKGYVKLNGKLRHTPLKQKGRFNITNISLRELNPYLAQNMYVSIEDGAVSLKGRTYYSPSKTDADLRVDSSFRINSLFVNDTQDNSSLFTLNELKTDAFTLELFPNRLYTNELNIDAFYVNAVVDENRSTNFAALSKNRDTNKSVSKEEDNSTKETNFPVNISKINVSNGSARFSDLSIPIHFSTHIHDLNGVVYAVSNSFNETSYVNISGEVNDYGSTTLKGSVDSANPKEFTDLDFNFQNLELSSLSGYSASFAGHEIDSGKLYLDLGYDILHSQLQGSNSIIMKKVVLGKEIDDENVTVLPLGFVLGLLEDSDGIIDIDMPVEGNVDEPDFKYGALVLKTMGNLITQAVTSPFRFLASAMGIDAENLEYISFEPGKTAISPPEREKLDQVAKMLLKKPKIFLSLSGSYDIVKDKKALQLEKLVESSMKKSGIKNSQENESIMNSELLEEIYEEMRDDDGLTQLQNSLAKKYKDEDYKRVYQKELINLCASIQEVKKEELIALAHNRAMAITSYLVSEKSIHKSRIVQNKTLEVNISEFKYVNTNMEVKVK